MKKIIKIFLGVAICMALLITGLDSMDHVNAETAYPVEQLSMSDYSLTKPPTMDGFVFAGWFTDQACTTKVEWDGASNDTNWAKFVPEKVLTLQWQLSKDAEKNSTKTNVRLVTAVAGLDYTNVGFSINGNSRTSETVYHKIYGADEEYTPERLFGSSATHFATYVIWGADNTVESPDATDDFGTSLTVIPQWTTLDGTLVQGKAREVVINDALYEARVENLSGNNAKTDRVWYDTLEAAVASANNGSYATTEGVVTVLQDAEIESCLNLTVRNMTIQNRYGKDITISRADTFPTGKMVYCSGGGKTQSLKTAENDAEGSLTVDATTTDIVDSMVIEVGYSDTTTVKFYLGEGVTITGANSDCSFGAVINVKKAATANLYGNITNNTSTNNASSLLHVLGTVTIADGTYSGNTGANGGVAYVANTGKFTISGGTFDDNEAYNGGVAYVEGTTTINGGEFKNNTTMTQDNGSKGGVVYVAKGTLNIEGGTFTGNNARLGGVVFNPAGASVNFNGGTFTSNSADNSGGVVYAQGALAITDGTFNQNQANTGHGGVVYGEGNLNISGGEFNSNIANGTQGGGVVYATNTLEISNGIFDNNQAYNGGVVFAAGTTTKISGGEFKNHTTMPQTNGSKGGVVFVNAGTLNITGGTFNNNSARLGGVAFNVAGATVEFNGGTFIDNSATGNGGVVYAQDVLDINDGEFTSNSTTGGGGVVYATSALTIEGGNFNTNTAEKGGVIFAGATTTISSATFNKNTATGSNGGGGGVVFCNATVTINSGNFTENSTTHTSAYGGVARVEVGPLTINGGTFSSNNSYRGGVVYTGKLTTITGGTFDGNYSLGGLGGSVLCSNDGEIAVLGAAEEQLVVFKNNYVNSAANNSGGGAIHLINKGKLTLENCEFTNNLHVGDTAGTGTDGCDIAFVRDDVHEFVLNDTSFDGAVRISDAHTENAFTVKDLDFTWTLSNVTTGLYNVDYTNKNLVPVSTTE